MLASREGICWSRAVTLDAAEVILVAQSIRYEPVQLKALENVNERDPDLLNS